MKVLLELLGDTSRVLNGVEGLQDFRPDSRKRVIELLKQLQLESERILGTQNKEEKTGGREVFVQRALEAISTGEHEVARGILEDGVLAHSDDFEMVNYLGLVAWEQGDLRGAEVAYHRAVQIVFGDDLDASRIEDGQDPALRAVEGRALALYRLGELDPALEYFQWLGEHFPSNYVGCRYLAGEIYHLRGEVSSAIEWYERVPVEPAVLYNMGLAMFQDHRLDEAVFTMIRGFVSNVHIATKLLGRYTAQTSCTPGYLGSEAYAGEFVDACRRLWHGAEGSFHFLQGCFDHRLVQSHLERCREQGGTRLLQAGDGAMKCSGWLEQLQDDGTVHKMSAKVLERLIS